MSRNFAPTQDITLADITAARFEQANDWSVGAFARFENFSTDERTVIVKWQGDARQFILRTTTGGAVDVWTGGSNRITTTATLSLNTWYLLVVTNAGGGGANDLKAYALALDGTFTVDGESGTHGGDSTLTAEIEIGVRDNTGDPMDGDLGHAFYIQKTLSKSEIRGIFANPGTGIMTHKDSGVPFWLPLGLGSPEPDYSGNANNGTLNGATVSDMPPTGHWFRYPAIWESQAAAGGPQTLSPSVVRVNINQPTSTVTGSGTVALTPSPVRININLPTGAITGAGAVTLSPSVVRVNFIIPTHTITAVAQLLQPSVVSININLPTTTIAGAGTATITPTEVRVNLNLPTATLTGSGTAALTPSVVQLIANIIQATVANVAAGAPGKSPTQITIDADGLTQMSLDDSGRTQVTLE